MKEINVQTVSLPASLHLQFHCQCSSLDLESQQHLQTPRSPQSLEFGAIKFYIIFAPHQVNYNI